MAHVLVTAFTSAEWGGIHEYVLLSAESLVSAGHQVTCVVRSGRFEEELRRVGAATLVVDWHDLPPLDTLFPVGRYSFDVIFAQPQKSRVLAIELGQRDNVPVEVLFHGYYADQAAFWKGQVDRFGGVSGSLVELLTGYCRVEPWRAFQVPNGIADRVLDDSPVGFEERVSEGMGQVTIASRLEGDKKFQWEALMRSMGALAFHRDIRWVVKVLGDGSNRDSIKAKIGAGAGLAGHIDVEFAGWLSPAEVESELRRSVFSVGAGRAALMSLAVGTPCIAAGKSAVVGLVSGRGLDVAVWSNYGDYPTFGAERGIAPLEDGIHAILSSQGEYEGTLQSARNFVDLTRRQSMVARELLAFLRL